MTSTALLLRMASAGIVCSVLPCAALPPAQSDYIKSSNAERFDQAYLKPSNTGANDLFGGSVSIFGDTIIAGARGEGSNATGVNGGALAEANNDAGNSGAGYVFTRSGGVWTQEAYIKPSNTNASDLFGLSVALSGDTAVVSAIAESSSATGVNAGAAAEADNSTGNAGAAYVFVRNAGVWSQQAYLKASNTGGQDSFGTSVAILDHTVAIGVGAEDSNGTGINPGAAGEADDTFSGAGAVYVFQRVGTAWSQFAYVKASNTGATDSFGRSVALAGDLLIAGATGEASSATGINPGGDAQTNEDQVRAGAVYVFTGFTSPVQPGVTAKPVITNFNVTSEASGRALNLSGKGQAQTLYRLEASATLRPPWQTLQSVQADGTGSFSFPTFHEPFATTGRFYRVAAP